VFGKGKLWQQHLSVTAPRDSARAADIRKAARLLPGKYLIKIYVDQENKLARQYPAELGEQELVAQIEVASDWPEGYGSMIAAQFPR
jgi:hypothetical protein